MEDESDFSSEVQIALQAVRKACVITKRLQEQIDIATITKTDSSPVTVADFASQAVVLQHLYQHFPEDLFLAEESSETLIPSVTEQIQQACGIPEEAILKECIDLGQSFFQSEERRRVWCLDPIDGTKGFLRKGQYCVALGLLENGIPAIGILACPNLPFDSETVGCIFVACKGQGCFQLPMIPESSPLIRLESTNPSTIQDPSKARFCVGVERGFGDPVGKCKAMAKHMHGKLDEDDEIVHSIRMDSQAKYGVVARGDAEFYVRLPKSGFRDWIWDVAPGVLVLEEVGGIVTDAEGNPLDFTKGAKLTTDGVLGAINAELHQALLDAYRQP
jgi:3'(2'), 5'-bisphosphate nucleotidase